MTGYRALFYFLPYPTLWTTVTTHRPLPMAQTDDAAAKQRYARELAAYTLQQWNIARERQLAREKELSKQPGKSQPKVDPLPTTSPNHLSTDDATAAAMKTFDYALQRPSQQNGEP